MPRALPRTVPTRARSAAAVVEPLEGRSLMSATFVTDGSISFLTNGVVTVQGTDYNDKVDVTVDKKGTESTADDRVLIVLNTPSSTLAETRYREVAAPQLKKIVFYGRASNDTFINRSVAASHVLAGGGNDTVVGGAGNDFLMGQDGFDNLYGQGGTDTLLGGNGNDFLDAYRPYNYKGSGYQTPQGGETVFGGDGLDTFRSGKGDVTDRKPFELLLPA